MIRFLIRVIVNGIAIAITALLLPGLTVVDNSILTYLLLGFGFGIINAFVRPVVLLLTSRLIILTLGWFILVINAGMLLLLGWLLPDHVAVNGIFPALFGGILMALIAVVLEAILGLAKPVGLDVDRDAPAWLGLERLPLGLANRLIENIRIQETYETFWRYGTDIALSNTALGNFRRWMQDRIYGANADNVRLSTPAKVRILLQELGTTYVKMGQILSSRTQFLPEEWQTELAKLQSDVPPFPSAVARQIITDELGTSPEDLFKTFDEQPFAAASTAQVHRAQLHDGNMVVVKIQRPNIVTQVRADLGIMRDVAGVLEKRTQWARSYNLAGTVDEFAKNVIQELDYTNESLNARRLDRNMAQFADIHIPKQYSHLTTSKVLTMEFVRGVKITDRANLTAAGLDLPQLGTTFVRSMIKQLLFDGYFHADPHPGNILVDPTTSKIVFLDTGMMGQLDQTLRLNLADLLFTLKTGDARDLGRVMVALSTPFRAFNEAAFNRDLDRVMSRYMDFAEEGDSFADSMGATLELMQKHGLRLNTDLTMALKAMMQAEEAALALDPNANLVDVAFDASRDLVLKLFDYDNVKDMVKKEAARSVKEVVRHIPTLQQATMKWLEQYESGRLTLHVDTQDLANQVSQFGTATRYLTVGIVLIGMLIGSALAANMRQSQLWPYLPDLAQLLFFLALLFSGAIVLGMVWKLWWD